MEGKTSIDDSSVSEDDAVDLVHMIRIQTEKLGATGMDLSKISDHSKQLEKGPGAQWIAPFHNDDDSETDEGQRGNMVETNVGGAEGTTSSPLYVAELVLEEEPKEGDFEKRLEMAREEGRKEMVEAACIPVEAKLVDEIGERRKKRFVVAVVVIAVALAVLLGVVVSTTAQRPTKAPVSPPTEPPSMQPIPSLVQQLMMLLETEMEPLSYPATNTPSAGDKALAWLADEDPLVPSLLRDNDIERLLQRFALLSFAFGNPSYPFEYIEMREDECLWPFVACSNVTRRVTSIFTEGNPLSGSLSESFGLLTELRQISFYAGELQGSLPSSFSQLTHLEEITIDVGGLSGPFPWSSLANMSNLVMFGIGDNAFSGALPTSILLPKLENFYLYRNAFTGTLPTQIASWSSLQTFSVESNFLTGTIPSEYAALTNLEVFTVGGNSELRGSLPAELGNWKQLDVFDVSFTNISGEIPPTFANWGKLTLGLLYNTELEGTLPLCALNKTIGMLIADCTKVSCPCCSDCCPISVGDVPQYGFCDY